MSHNQSRAERGESVQYRKTGRSGSSNQQRNFPAGVPTKGGGGASSAPSNSGRRSFKKYNNTNGQGDSAANAVQNDPPLHQPAQMTSTPSNVKPTEAPSQKITRAVPKAPSSNVPISASTSVANLENGVPTTPAKGDGSKSFALQFGSISPGLMNGVQIPARTNLDEQKQEQVRRELLRTAPMPVPSIPKHHLQKDDQNNTSESQPVSKMKRDQKISAASSLQVTQIQKPAPYFRPGQGGNYGILRNPLAQAPAPYGSGILSGPMQFLGPQGGGPQRNNADSDRWQRATGFVKGYPQSPAPVIHRAEKKYEIGKVTDEEQAKQRQLKGILNKLTPQNFEKLFQQVKEVNIDNVVTLSGVISQIFDKALMEPTFCEMYADFCFHLAADLPELSVDNEKITFKRLLLNKCQEEFERGEREEEEANKAEEEGECKQTPEEREEKRLRVRRRMLGNIRLIGELYKKRMLTERIMHECINKLLGQYQNPDEENIEALCKLMSTIGEMIDHPKAKDHMDAYFDIMTQLSNNMRLSSRVRFMLKDSIDLRRNKWQQRRKVEGPKKIEEVHRDAAQERHAQSSRLARVPSMGGSARRGPPMEFAPRGGGPSMMSSPGPHMGGGFRGGPSQARVGYGFSQDTRSDSFDNNRAMPVPLPQRPLGDENITLGPQGGLFKGMGFRGQQSTGGVHLADVPSHGDPRRVDPGQNGFNTPERVGYGPDSRFVSPTNYDAQERSVAFGNRSLLASPTQVGPPSNMHGVSLDKVWSEEQLRDKSMATIKEFYSARDENEVALCIKDLNTPSFYPSMISIWLADSFERKDKEREVLTNLLINLSKPQDGIISEDQLVKGFESVLAVLEDAVNDAPRAAEFLGHTFASFILQKLVSLSEIGRLIYEGGEEQGRLVEIGLAADVLASTLDTIKSEKGDSVLNEIRSGSNLRLENFRPAGSKKSLKIDKFM